MLLNDDGSASVWPDARAIVGNPPFLGARKMKPEVGESYVTNLRKAYKATVPNGADLVCFWFAKAWSLMQNDAVESVGLVATNSITGGANRRVLEPIARASKLAAVWRDEPWVVDGAAVRVSIAVFNRAPFVRKVDDEVVDEISSDLRGSTAGRGFAPDRVKKLRENHRVAFQGIVLRSNVKKSEAERLGLPSASFAMPGTKARAELTKAGNPNGRPNSDVLFPFINGDDITGRPSDRFLVDFTGKTASEASMYEGPFKHIEPVKQHRAAMGQPEALATWWQPWRPRPEMRQAFNGLIRYMATSAVAKHRNWIWLPTIVRPDHAVIVVARDDSTTFGIVHSTFHELWSTRMGTRLGVGNDPRYTPTTSFETFPFPDGMELNILSSVATDQRAQRIATAADGLVSARDLWLNPPAWTTRVPEVVPGYPDRLQAVMGFELDLKQRTLTNLYNLRPAWLMKLHDDLDAAVASAYGWPWPMSEDEILQRLFDLNQSRK